MKTYRVKIVQTILRVTYVSLQAKGCDLAISEALAEVEQDADVMPWEEINRIKPKAVAVDIYDD